MVCFPARGLPADVVPGKEELAGGDIPHLLVGEQAVVHLDVGQIAGQIFTKPDSGYFVRSPFIAPGFKPADEHISNLSAI